MDEVSVENKIFRKNFKYRQKFINVCILRIKYGHRSERTIRGYKTYVFKMMHDIVRKNICNYTNLLTNGTSIREIPTHDDILADVYLMFDKCLDKYQVRKGNKFYFYFNKSLSRNFFREYQKIQKQSAVDLSSGIEIMHPHLRYESNNYDVELLMHNLHFTETEKRIVRSRMLGQCVTEFLKENKDISKIQYSTALKKMKSDIRNFQENEIW